MSRRKNLIAGVEFDPTPRMVDRIVRAVGKGKSPTIGVEEMTMFDLPIGEGEATLWEYIPRKREKRVAPLKRGVYSQPDTPQEREARIAHYASLVEGGAEERGESLFPTQEEGDAFMEDDPTPHRVQFAPHPSGRGMTRISTLGEI